MKTFSKTRFVVNRNFDRKRSEYYSRSAVASVRNVSLPEDCVKVSSDVQLLFNQKRIAASLGKDTLEAWLDGLSPKDAGIDTSKFTNDQLLSFIKSRHLQSLSELRAWSTYLNQSGEQILNEFKSQVESEQLRQLELVKAAQQQQKQQQTKTE